MSVPLPRDLVALRELLQRSTHPLLLADERIDGDALGAALALARYLKRKGSSPRVVLASTLPPQYRFLPGAETCVQLEDLQKYPEGDLLIALDCSDALFVQRVVEFLPRPLPILNIDHHRTNPLYGNAQLVDATAPATCELVWRLLTLDQEPLSPEEATCLLSGIAFDTTLFTNDGTSVRAFEAASDLLRQGARRRVVLQTLVNNRSLGSLALWGRALSRLQTHALGFVMTFFTREDMRETKATDHDVDGFSDFLHLLLDAETLIVLRETPEGGVKASMRTTNGDVSSLARVFGGGGHRKAAGFTVPQSHIVVGLEGTAHIEKVLSA